MLKTVTLYFYDRTTFQFTNAQRNVKIKEQVIERINEYYSNATVVPVPEEIPPGSKAFYDKKNNTWNIKKIEVPVKMVVEEPDEFDDFEELDQTETINKLDAMINELT